MMDDNGGGIVLLDEWSFFIKNCEVAAGTPMGKLLNEDEEGGVGKKEQLFSNTMTKSKPTTPPKSSNSGRSKSPGRKKVPEPEPPKKRTPLKRGAGNKDTGPAKSAEELQAELKEWLKTKPPFETTAEPTAFGLAIGKTASKDLKDFTSCFEPLAAETPEGEKLRDEGFLAADPNGNGLCSLAEIETFVLKRLLSKYPNTGKGKDLKTPGQDLFKAFRPCYIRAFKDAADYAKDDGKTIKGTKSAKQDDFVDKSEFRLFCVYVCIYASMVTKGEFNRQHFCKLTHILLYFIQFDAFSKIDGGGAGRDANDDKRIELDEWLKGYKGVNDHGFVAFQGISTKGDATAIFKMMDDNGGGIVLLDEWSFFIKNCEVAAGTPMGKLLNEDEEGGVGKKEQLFSNTMTKSKPTTPPKSSNSGRSKSPGRKKVPEPEPPKKRTPLKRGAGNKDTGPAKSAEELQAELKEWLKTKPPFETTAEPTAFGLAIGKTASKDLKDFTSCFEPLAAETPEGEKLRDEGFLAADPNGNGLCSLAEIETFVLKRLLSKYPNTGKGKDLKTPGQDLFKAFRPCYIRAFKDAADYAKDDGKTIKGTKSAKQDDFVDKSEFRLFCVYVCIYASMVTKGEFNRQHFCKLTHILLYFIQFDAFSKIDGGGAGRDANDDKRIELDEWLKGYKGVNDHGFVAFQGILSKQEATDIFKRMDDNGGGIVLLDEWSFFLKQEEIKAGTALGKILNEDEAGGVGKQETLFANTMGKPPAKKSASPKTKKKTSPKAALPPGGGFGARKPTPAHKGPLKRGGGVKARSTEPAGPTKTAAELQAELKEWLKTKPPFKSEAKVNAFGLAVGKTASKDLVAMINVFEPLAAETPEGDKLRVEGFISADPNGDKTLQSYSSAFLFNFNSWAVLMNCKEMVSCHWPSARPSSSRAYSPNTPTPEKESTSKRQGKTYGKHFGPATSELSRTRQTLPKTMARQSRAPKAPNRTTSSTRASSAFSASMCAFMPAW